MKNEPQVIDLRAASGGVEYTWPLTLVEDSVDPITGKPKPKDIHLDVVKLSLGTDSAPGTWRTPDVDTSGADCDGLAANVKNTRTVQLLVGGAYRPPASTYTLWSQIGDTPEVVPRKHFRVVVLTD